MADAVSQSSSSLVLHSQLQGAASECRAPQDERNGSSGFVASFGFGYGSEPCLHPLELETLNSIPTLFTLVTQRLQYPLIKEYTLKYSRIPNII